MKQLTVPISNEAVLDLHKGDPVALHYDVVRQALAAGKHVLCEKPLCLTGAEADALVDLADERGLRPMVGHVFMFNPGILKLKELVRAGELGSRIYYLFARRTNLGPIRKDVNAVLDPALARRLDLQLPARRGAHAGVGGRPVVLQPGIQDVAVITLTYPGGVIGSIHVSWLDPKKVREITVVGDRRMATWDDLSALGPVMMFDKGVTKTPREYADFGEFQLLPREGDVTVPRVPPAEPLRLQAQAFIDALDAPEKLRSDGRAGAQVVRVLAAINESIANGGAPVAVGAAAES